MIALAVLTGFCAALVLVLAWVVLALRRDVASLHAELAANQQADVPVEPAPTPVAAPPAPQPVAPSLEPQPVVRTVVSLDGRDEEPEPEPERVLRAEHVPVITAITDPVDDVDLTARRVASVTLARPLIKVAALGFGVRQALDDEHRLRVRLTMKRELKRQRKMRRRRRAGRAPLQGRDT